MKKLLMVVAVIAALYPLAALADRDRDRDRDGWSGYHEEGIHLAKHDGDSRPGSTPLPLAGVGLPGLALAGAAYLFYRRRRRGE